VEFIYDKNQDTSKELLLGESYIGHVYQGYKYDKDLNLYQDKVAVKRISWEFIE